MKTFTKSLIAAGVGLVGSFSTANAALPYNYPSSSYGNSYGSSYGSSYGIAVGGCYGPATTDNCGTGYGDAGYGHSYGSTYHPTSYGRSTWYDTTPYRSADYTDRFHTLPYSSSRGTSLGGWNDECGYNQPSRRPTTTPSFHDRYEDRYDGSPMFEPWRPASASSHGTRWNW
jgi:hypothetical protein